MTTLPQTTAIRPLRAGGSTQLAPVMAGGPLANAGAPVSSGMSGGDLWRIIRNNVWLIVLMMTLSGVGGYVVHKYLERTSPRYTAAGYIQIKVSTEDPFNHKRSEEVDTGNLLIEQKTQAAYLTSDALLTKVLQNDGSDIRKTAWFMKFKGDIPAAKEDFQEYYVVRPLPETRLVRVEFTNAIPKDCQAIVREMGTQHIQDEAERIFLQGQQRSQTLKALQTKFRLQFQETEAKLMHLRSQVTGMGGGAMSRVNIKETELEALRRDQSTLDMQAKSTASMLEMVQKSLATGIDPAVVDQAVETNGFLQNLKLQSENAQQNYDAYRDRLGPSHPQVISLEKAAERSKQKTADYEAELRAKTRNMAIEQFTNQAGTSKTALDQMTARIEQVTQDLGDMANQMVAYYSTEAAQVGNSAQLKQIDEQLSFIEAEQNQKLAGKVTWAVLPETPTTRSFPRWIITMPIAFSIGLAVTMLVVFLREVTDSSIRSPRDIHRIGQMTLLGMIGDEAQDPQAAGARLPLVIFDAPHSMTAEQLRQVRTRLQHAASLDTTRSLLITSPGPGDGKTTVACNLAAGLALNGRRILLVDGNFRRPEIHKVFAVPNEQGFSDVLNGAVTFDEVVQETQVPNLAVMTSGPKPINATEMFESQLLMDFIERALEEFDHVIFDSGPMMVVSESAAMAPRVDGVVTVVRARSNSRGLLQRMRDTLRAIKAEHLGVVLNGVRAQGGGYYGRTIKTYYEYQNT